jgi:GTP pyrophosphokinase
MSPQKLLNTIKKYHPKADLDMVRLAFEFAAEAHRGQKRLSGEDYILHPLATAQILAEMKLGVPIIIAALLHDVPEDTKFTLEDVRKNFGDDVAGMVRGITKLGKIKYRGMELYIENLRKMFIAMAEDLRVVLIKFADRLHNLRTLGALSSKKQYRIALETLEIYAPIANRLGMGELKGELEDIAFKFVFPKDYWWVNNIVKEKFVSAERYLERVKKILARELDKAGIEYVSIDGRRKHFYSLYKKLLEHDRDITKIHDLIALRAIFKNVADCYAALGVAHQKWKPLKGRIKDYIAQPKPNGYRSLHTTVFCEDGEIVEFQLRTQEMHDEAEYGIAAHWQYDEAGKKVLTEPKQVPWMKELVKIQKEIEGKKEYLESLETLKIDVFHNRIFVFTPKGDVIDLPEGATPIDFAYAIHSDIGDKCVGAVINDEMASLRDTLKSGDVVLIITDKNRKTPSADWVKFVRTAGARGKIRARLREKKM